MRRPPYTTALALTFALAACASSNNAQQPPANTPTTTTAARSTTTHLAGLTPFAILNHENDALNRGDVATSIGYFAPNAVLITPLGGCNPCIGRDVIREHWSGAAANQVKVTLSDPTTIGDIVTVKTTMRSPQFPTDITRALGSAIASVHAGKITRLDQRYDNNDPQTRTLLTLATRPANSATPTSP